MFTSVTKQVKRAVGAVKSVLAIAGTAATVLDPRLKTYLKEGEQLDGLEPVQLTLVRWIEEDHNRLEEYEAVQRAAQRTLTQMRLRRDKKKETLYTKLLRIRKTFEDAFGQGTASVFLGLGPRLSELEPQVLRRQARETVAILGDSQFSPPPALVEGIWENPEQYADQIRDALTPFQASLDEIEFQKREVEKAQKDKTDLLEELHERLKWSIRWFEAIYQLAGLGFHADRLRVSLGTRSSSEPQPAASSDGDAPETGEEGASEASETLESSRSQTS